MKILITLFQCLLNVCQLTDHANNESKAVYVVDQINPDNNTFDEHKIMLGYQDETDAKKSYLENYDKNWQGIGALNKLSLDEFKDWVKSGKTKKPLSWSGNYEQKSIGKSGERKIEREDEKKWDDTDDKRNVKKENSDLRGRIGKDKVYGQQGNVQNPSDIHVRKATPNKLVKKYLSMSKTADQIEFTIQSRMKGYPNQRQIDAIDNLSRGRKTLRDQYPSIAKDAAKILKARKQLANKPVVEPTEVDSDKKNPKGEIKAKQDFITHLKPSDGKPYKTRRAAQVAIKGRGRRDLKNKTLLPVEVDGGWGLKEEQKTQKGKNSEPYINLAQFNKAKKFITRKSKGLKAINPKPEAQFEKIKKVLQQTSKGIKAIAKGIQEDVYINKKQFKSLKKLVKGDKAAEDLVNIMKDCK